MTDGTEKQSGRSRLKLCMMTPPSSVQLQALPRSSRSIGRKFQLRTLDRLLSP